MLMRLRSHKEVLFLYRYWASNLLVGWLVWLVFVDCKKQPDKSLIITGSLVLIFSLLMRGKSTSKKG